jgi:PAS domain S-box-containing protein
MSTAASFAEFSPQWAARFHLFARAAAGCVLLMTLIVLAGWILGADPVKNVVPGFRPGFATMKVNAAAALMLCGFSLWLLTAAAAGSAAQRAAQRAGQACAAVSALAGLLTLLEYTAGWDLGIDEILLRDLTTPASIHPGRMSPITSLEMLLIGSALLLRHAGARNARWISEVLALTATFLSALALIGYAYGVSALYRIGVFSSMALHTAAGCALLSIGLLLAHPRNGTVAILSSNTSGGVVLRRLLPAAVLIPPVLGWAGLAGERLQYYDAEFGAALIATLHLLIFSGLIFWSGNSIHRQESSRRRVQEEINRLFTFSHDLLCVAGFDGCFKRLNPAWEATLGYTLDELMAKPYVEFVHPDDRGKTAMEAERLSSGQLTARFENRYRAKDGSYRWLSWNSYPIGDERLIYGSARDITQRREAEEQVRLLNDALERQVQDLDRTNRDLEATNKDLEAFTYSVSHDLRAPLRHIDGFSRILEDEYGPRLDSSASRYLQRIRQGTRNMGELIDDLLSLSRVGRQELHRQATGLNALLEEARTELQVLAELRGGRRNIEWRIGPLPFADCDPVLIKQVFINLLSNALKYTRPRKQPVIEAGCCNQNGETVLFVRDNGVGFSMKYADKLFGVFQRLHRQEDFEGTGVGLATVQRILQKHGGRIWAEAELDRGACFYFTVGPDVQEASLGTSQAAEVVR